MIHINLAPGAETRRPSGRRQSKVAIPKMPAMSAGSRPVMAGAGVGLILLVIVFAIWRLGVRRSELEAQLQTETTDSTRFATTIELVQALRSRQDTIQQKIGVIREVDQRRYVWPHLLDEISTAVPAFTWLREISSTEAADTTQSAGIRFTLQGNAASTQALTRLMKNLEASPFVRGVTLITSEQEEEQGRVVHQFTLEAQYESPDSTAIQTVPIITIQ